MKEIYYTRSSINRQAKIFRDRISMLRDRHNFPIYKDKVALLVIDCQNFFFDPSSHAFASSVEGALPNIIRLQNYCLQNGILVIQTHHVNKKEDVRMMDRWWQRYTSMSIQEMGEIIHELQHPDCVVVKKSQYDAFYKTNLEDILKANDIEQLIIVGAVANLCCETTARSAFVRGYEVFFGIDSTATYNRELHLGSLMNLAHGFAIPMLTKEIMAQLK